MSHNAIGKVNLRDYDIYNAVRKLSPEAKKAMFSAATHGRIKRGTWNGCAFNAGGLEVGDPKISSVIAAARVFNMSVQDVSYFIRCWDQLEGTDDECTQLLRDTIEKVGIYEPANARRKTTIERKIVYKSLATQKAEFEQEMEKYEIPFEDEAANLLCMAAA